MNYIVIDFEYNQNFDFKTGAKAPSNPLMPLEIIQIGAVKLDDELNITGHFGTTVAPRLYRSLNPFVARVTGLMGRQLRNSPPFKEAYRGLLHFIGKDPAILCFWGNDDIKEMFRNILFTRQNHRRMPLAYINVQQQASIHLELPPKQQMALASVVEQLGIETTVPFHNAVNDAYYTAEIFKLIFDAEAPGLLNFDLDKLIERNTELTLKESAESRNGT